MNTTISPAEVFLRALFFYGCLILTVSTSAFAQNEVVTVEGPVEIVSSSEVPGRTIYWVKNPQQVRYQVVVPESDRERFVAAVRQSPSTVVRFDGTVVDDDTNRVLKVNKWSTVTTTTSTTDTLGNTVTRKTTTVTR